MIELLTVFNRALSLLVILFSAAVLHWSTARRLSRANTFFGARVETGFADSSAGQAILKEFRRRIWWCAVVSAAASIPIPVSLATFAGLISSSIAGLAAFALAYAHTRREAAPTPEPAVRLAPLATGHESGSLWLEALDWLAMILPSVAPAATLTFLFFRRHQMPANFHAELTIFQLFFGLILGLMCAVNQWALRFRARSSDWAPTPGASRKYRTYLGAMPAFVFVFIVCQICVLSLMPFHATVPWLRHLSMPNYFLVTFPAQAIWLVSVWRMRKWLTNHLATESSDPMPDACWKWGCAYFNSNDPALVVPARTGIGYSFNCGHASVWVVAGTVTALTIASLVQSFGSLAHVR